MLLAKARYQRRHMTASKTGRRGDTQVAAGLDTACRHAGLGIGKVDQQALAVFHERAALVRQRYAPRCAHQQLHTQTFFQRIQPPPHDGRGHALGIGSGGQAAARRHRHE